MKRTKRNCQPNPRTPCPVIREHESPTRASRQDWLRPPSPMRSECEWESKGLRNWGRPITTKACDSNLQNSLILWRSQHLPNNPLFACSSHRKARNILLSKIKWIINTKEADWISLRYTKLLQLERVTNSKTTHWDLNVNTFLTGQISTSSYQV